MQKILVIGSDAKTSLIASLLGKQISVMNFGNNVTDEALKISDVIILPLPATDGEYITGTNVKTDSIFKYKNKLIIGGRIPKTFANHDDDFTIVDYTVLDSFAIRNAVPTAEAAISLAIENTAFTLHGSKCLITGYGRIAKCLAKMLRNMNADVTCMIRNNSQIAQAEADGFKIIGYDNYEMFRYDIIFNTVPYPVFDQNRLLQTDTKLIIDLASLPGGCDFDAAKEMGIKTIHALSLPGRTAPVTAARITADTIFEILKGVTK